MTKLPRLNAKELMKVAEKRGFFRVRQSGSHIIYRNKDGVRLTLPFHGKKILHPKIIKDLLNDMDINLENLKKLF